MKLDQLCFYAEYGWQADEIKTMLGLRDAPWVQDTVTLLSRFPFQDELNQWHEGIAELNFCEALGPQVEIMRWLHGPFWNFGRDKAQYFIGHIGFHVMDGEEWPPMEDGLLVQESKTIGHTAAAFNDTTSPQFGRRYNYRIYKMPHGDNIYIKLIRRVHRVG